MDFEANHGVVFVLPWESNRNLKHQVAYQKSATGRRIRSRCGHLWSDGCAANGQAVEFTSALEVDLSLRELPAFMLWSGSAPRYSVRLAGLTNYCPQSVMLESRRVCGSSQYGVVVMDTKALSGRSILVVEEELGVALSLEDHFRQAGATVYGADNLRDALHMAHHPALSAAVVNLKLGADSTAAVCRHLTQLGIPFVFHTRHDAAEASKQWPNAPVLNKPANGRSVVRSVASLLH